MASKAASKAATRERGHAMLPTSAHSLAANDTAAASTPPVVPTTPLVVNGSTAAAAAVASLAQTALANVSNTNVSALLANSSLSLVTGFYDNPSSAAGQIQQKDDANALERKWVIMIVFITVFLPVVLIGCCCMCKPRTPWADKPVSRTAEEGEKAASKETAT